MTNEHFWLQTATDSSGGDSQGGKGAGSQRGGSIASTLSRGVFSRVGSLLGGSAPSKKVILALSKKAQPAMKTL